MKKLIIGLLALGSLNAFADDICIAEKIHEINYSSIMRYDVSCVNESFSTKEIITSFIFPLPYNWSAKAKSILNSAMSGRGYIQTHTFASPDLFYPEAFKDYLVFEKRDEKAEFCMVIKMNKSTTGYAPQRTVFDTAVYCNSSAKTDLLKAINDSDLERFMSSKGSFRKVLTKIHKKRAPLNPEKAGVPGVNMMLIEEMMLYKN